MSPESRDSTPSPQALEGVIMELIRSCLDKKIGGLGPGAPLFAGKVVFDSFSLMEFILRLEQSFCIHIPDEDLDPEIFYSVKTIVGYVQRLLDKANGCII